MPAEPIVINASAASRRHQAWGESVCDAAARGGFDVVTAAILADVISLRRPPAQKCPQRTEPQPRFSGPRTGQRDPGNRQLIRGNLLQLDRIRRRNSQVDSGPFIRTERQRVDSRDRAEQHQRRQVGAMSAGMQIVIPPEIERTGAMRFGVDTIGIIETGRLGDAQVQCSLKGIADRGCAGEVRIAGRLVEDGRVQVGRHGGQALGLGLGLGLVVQRIRKTVREEGTGRVDDRPPVRHRRIVRVGHSRQVGENHVGAGPGLDQEHLGRSAGIRVCRDRAQPAGLTLRFHIACNGHVFGPMPTLQACSFKKPHPLHSCRSTAVRCESALAHRAQAAHRWANPAPPAPARGRSSATA